jgi:tellurite resistance protein
MRTLVSTRKGSLRGVRRSMPRLTLDDAFIAILIGAMDANRHVSREEAARAHHIIWSMRRFRRKSGDRVNRIIEAMRSLIETEGTLSVIAAAAQVIPDRLRGAAFAVSADLVLADGTIEPAERRFLNRLAKDLRLERRTREGLVRAMLVKNAA